MEDRKTLIELLEKKIKLVASAITTSSGVVNDNNVSDSIFKLSQAIKNLTPTKEEK